MRSFPAALVTALQQGTLGEGVLDVLVEIDATTPIYRVLSNEKSVTWNGNSFLPDKGGFSVINENIDGKRPQVTLSLQNILAASDGSTALPWAAWLQANNPNGVEVKFRFVATAEGSAAEHLEARWYISGVNELNVELVRFHVGSPHDVAANAVPRISLGAHSCMWLFKKGPCKSTSSRQTCPKTFKGCDERFPAGAVRNFGPSFPLSVGSYRRAG